MLMKRLLTSASATIGIVILIAGLITAYNYIEGGGSVVWGCVVVLLTSFLAFLFYMDTLFRER